MTKEDFKKLFDQHFDELRRYVFYRCGDTELATDITQECFLKIWEKKNKVELNKVKGLLFKMAADLFISKYRQQKRDLHFFKHFYFEEADYSPEELLSFKQLKEHYETILHRMPDKQRVVFLMSRIDGLKYHEIASNLGLSVKAVEKRMKNALELLRDSLK